MQKNVYEKAIYYYLECIKMIKQNKNEEIHIIVLSNLVEAYLKYGYYTNALSYSNKSLELLKKYNDKIKNGGKINEKLEVQKQKVAFRRIKVLKGIRKFYKIYDFLYDKIPQNCQKNNLKIFDLFYEKYNCNIKLSEILSHEKIQELLNLPDFKNILSDLEEKISNEQGYYNFYNLLKMEQKNFNLDCADFYNHKISLDFDNKKGILIRANEDIKKGELIIAEKAVYTSSCLSKKADDFFKNNEYDILIYNYLLEKFKKHPNDAKKLNLLYNGVNGFMNLEKRYEKIDEKITQEKFKNIILKNMHKTRRYIYIPNEISRGLFYISSF